MTPEKQRIKIAEACPNLFSFNSEISMCRKGRPHELVDPLTDLNAMHEAEKVLRKEVNYYQPGGWGIYEFKLRQVCGNQNIVCATAAQRAEAFLKALGLWEEE
jgi:hypothetical protein